VNSRGGLAEPREGLSIGAQLLANETRSQDWSEAVLLWQGDPDFAPFESHRAKLAEPVKDPLA
jgi:hypothetical protein